MAVDDQAVQNSESPWALIQLQDSLATMVITADAHAPFDKKWPDYTSDDEEGGEEIRLIMFGKHIKSNDPKHYC